MVWDGLLEKVVFNLNSDEKLGEHSKQMEYPAQRLGGRDQFDVFMKQDSVTGVVDKGDKSRI